MIIKILGQINFSDYEFKIWHSASNHDHCPIRNKIFVGRWLNIYLDLNKYYLQVWSYTWNYAKYFFNSFFIIIKNLFSINQINRIHQPSQYLFKDNNKYWE